MAEGSSRDRETLEELRRFGVDLTLVREMLRLSPDERLAWHGRVLHSIRRLREAATRGR